MKHIKKILALALALCFFATVPLTAAASSAYDTYVIGTWSAYQVYNGDTKETQNVGAGVSYLYINRNGTAKWIAGSTTYTGTWSYSKTDSYGYWFNIKFAYEGSTVTLQLVYITIKGANYGQAIMMGNGSSTLFVFKKV